MSDVHDTDGASVADLQEEVGGGAVADSGEAERSASDWRRAHRDRRALDRRLPAGLREPLAVVRRDDAGDELASGIIEDAAAIVRRRADGGVRNVTEAGDVPWSYVLPAREREILRDLDSNDTYRAQVRGRVRKALRRSHLVKVDPGAAQICVPRSLGAAPRVINGVLEVKSDIGLGTASVLEAEPEAWDHWAAAEIIRGWMPASFYASSELRVVVVGALAGGFARVVTALDSPLPRLTVTELDWVLKAATNLTCVEGRGSLSADARFDAAVVVLPSPATSQVAGQRRIYDNKSDFDLGRLGPARWSREVAAVVTVVAAHLEVGARAYVLVPLGTRSRRAYVEAPELLAAVLEAARAAGLAVEASVETVEVAPVAQPFIEKIRPKKTTLVLRKVSP